MPHPTIDNPTPFAFAPLLVSDEAGQPVVATLIKATYAIAENGALTLAEKQPGIDFAGTLNGDPETASLRYEPETAFTKPGVDLALIGHAYAQRPGATVVEVGFQVGRMAKTVRIFGDRLWVKRLIGIGISDPEPFERIPLIYERAFGGWDRSHANPERHAYEARNPLGVGFRAKGAAFSEGVPLPNLEDPEAPVKAWGKAVPPAGFGFVAPDWEPRRNLGGTYDAGWSESRSPLLPADFDRRFFNAAAPGLVSAAPLAGNEPVLVRNATATGDLSFNLPGLSPPSCLIARRTHGDARVDTRLDTVIVDADDRRLTLIWRGFAPIPEGAHGISAIRVLSNADSPAAIGA